MWDGNERLIFFCCKAAIGIAYKLKCNPKRRSPVTRYFRRDHTKYMTILGCEKKIMSVEWVIFVRRG